MSQMCHTTLLYWLSYLHEVKKGKRDILLRYFVRYVYRMSFQGGLLCSDDYAVKIPHKHE